MPVTQCMMDYDIQCLGRADRVFHPWRASKLVHTIQGLSAKPWYGRTFLNWAGLVVACLVVQQCGRIRQAACSCPEQLGDARAGNTLAW